MEHRAPVLAFEFHWTHNEWLQAIKEDDETTCNFDYSVLDKSVLLGSVAYQSELSRWDSKKLQVTNSDSLVDSQGIPGLAIGGGCFSRGN